MLNLFLTPSRLFQRIAKSPGWVLPFAIVVLLNVAAVLLTEPISQQVFLHTLPPGMDGARLAQIQSSLRISSYLSLLLSPIVIFLRIGILVVLFYAATVVLTGADVPYRRIVSLLTYCSVFTALDRLGGVIMNYLVGADNLERPADMQTTFLSANAFFHPANPLLRSLFDNLSPFTIWYLVLVAAGMTVIARVPRSRAVMITFAVWLIQTVFLCTASLLFAQAGNKMS
jgi:hypothetical protein